MSFFGEEKPAAAPAPVREQFSRRTEVEPRKRQRGTEETVHSFTMRVRVEASNRFVDWCERERMSYREGFDRLMALIDKAGDHR